MYYAPLDELILLQGDELTPEEVESLNVLTEKIIPRCKDMGVRGERKHGRHHRHGKGRSCRK